MQSRNTTIATKQSKSMQYPTWNRNEPKKQVHGRNILGRLAIEGKQVENLNNENYLGTWVNENHVQSRELRHELKLRDKYL